MKKLILIVGLLLAASGYTHDELFPACPSPHPAHPETTEETIKPPKAMYKEAPDYPTRALAKRKEGSVILEYTVNTEGRVVNETVIGSTSKSFTIAAKKAAKNFLYEPAIDTKTNLPIEYQLKHKITFELEKPKGYESDSLESWGIVFDSDILDFNGGELTRLLYDVEKMSNKIAIKKIDEHLEEAENGFEKAVLLFQRAGKKQDSKPPDIEGMKKDLDAVFALLGQLNEFDPNVIFLQAYTVDALSGVYLDQQDDWKAASLLRPFLEKAWSQYAPKQTYDAYINLAIAAFNLNNFCVSYHSFDRAVKAGSKLKIKNNKLIEYRDMVKEKL
jgi:TonB family protein